MDRKRSICLRLSYFALHFLPEWIACTTDFLVGRTTQFAAQ